RTRQAPPPFGVWQPTLWGSSVQAVLEAMEVFGDTHRGRARSFATAARRADTAGGDADAACLPARVVRNVAPGGIRERPPVRDRWPAGSARDLRGTGPAIHHRRVVFRTGRRAASIRLLLEFPVQSGLSRRVEPVWRAHPGGASRRRQSRQALGRLAET